MSADLTEEFLIALNRGFGAALGVYVAYRLILWAREGRPIDEYGATVEVDEDVQDVDDADDADAAEEATDG